MELRERLRPAEVEVETARKELMRARSRLQSLEEIQSATRPARAACRWSWSTAKRSPKYGAELSASAGLTRRPNGAGGAGLGPAGDVHGIMADFITAPAHLESAVSAMLGDRLQGVVVDAPVTGASGVELLKQLKEGRTTFLPGVRGSR